MNFISLFVISKFCSKYYCYNQEIKGFSKRTRLQYTLCLRTCALHLVVCACTRARTHTYTHSWLPGKPFSNGKEIQLCLCRWKSCDPICLSALTMERKNNESTPWQDGREESSSVRMGEGPSEPSLRQCWVGSSEILPSLLQSVNWPPPVSWHWLMRPQNLLLSQAEAS